MGAKGLSFGGDVSRREEIRGTGSIDKLYARGIEGALSVMTHGWAEDTLKRRKTAAEEYESWMKGIPGKGWGNSTPWDVLTFMETQYRDNHFGRKDGVLSFSAINSVLSHLSTEFEMRLQQGEWKWKELEAQVGRGNPVRSVEVQRYRAGYQRMLAKEGIVSKPAKPMAEETLQKLAEHLKGESYNGAHRCNRVAAARDRAVFLYLGESWQRGGEGCRLQFESLGKRTERSVEIEIGPTKTFPCSTTGIIVLDIEAADPALPSFMSALTEFLDICSKETGFEIDKGPLFRTIRRDKRSWNSEAMKGDSLYQRLVGHLKHIGMYRGESLHSFRRAGVVDALLNGTSLTSIQQRGFWKNEKTPKRYARDSPASFLVR